MSYSWDIFEICLVVGTYLKYVVFLDIFQICLIDWDIFRIAISEILRSENLISSSLSLSCEASEEEEKNEC